MKQQQGKATMSKSAMYVFFLFLISVPARAEVTGTDEFNNLNFDDGQGFPTVETTSINATEGSVLQNTVFNQTGPVENTNIANEDISNKFGQSGAAGSSAIGKAAAIATGASLMAAGVPMTASIIPSVKAAGYALIAKAALEFAQAGADAGTEAANRDIETDTLRFNDDNPEPLAVTAKNSVADAQRATANEIAGKINSEGLNQLLTDRGVNSEAFINALSTGDIRSIGDIASAMGDTTSFSESDLLKGEELAASKLGEEMDSLRIQVNEDNEDNGTGGFGGSGGLLSGDPNNGSVLDQGLLPGVRGAAGHNGSGSGLASTESNVGPGGLSLGNLLGKFGKDGKRAANGLVSLTIDQLHKLGLVKLRRGMSIFQKAGRSYRSYGRWRDKELKTTPRVASHP